MKTIVMTGFLMMMNSLKNMNIALIIQRHLLWQKFLMSLIKNGITMMNMKNDFIKI